MPESVLHFYDVVVSFDIVIIDAGLCLPDGQSRILRDGLSAHAVEPMNFAALLDNPNPQPNGSCGTAGPRHSNFSREGYIAALRHVIDLILAGDVFQANIAQRLTARLSTSFDPLAFYWRLRSLKPTPFAALLRYGKAPIASSSPERFLKLDG
ncbi:chorismate-binding protein [Bradyrhizobium hereditatis]|uniref:chorismate-binding protein n=1 Tax=Bradyrhizobium hereditatis TaxID=2821405 RepID=UPI0024C00A51|nr:chorismate-binding protein [Bradyrhizobium hereditatis]